MHFITPLARFRFNRPPSLLGSRARCLVLLCALRIATSACVAGAANISATTNSQINVILIIGDDLNNWIGPMGGHPQAQTPNLDKLAARGVTFTNAQCPAPLCNPSRTAFMSGMRPSTTGVYDNDTPWRPRVAAGLCINDYIRQFGYTSLSSGKVYHYLQYRAEEWDQVYYVTDDTLPLTSATRRPGPFGYRMFTDDNPTEQYNEKRAESVLVDAKSVTWCIDRLSDVNAPFFMACGIHRPHTPWDVPKKYFDKFPLATIQLPPTLETDRNDLPQLGKDLATTISTHATILNLGIWQDRVRAYLAAICYMDEQIGRLLDALENSPYRDNTAIVFVGDNGWHLGSKKYWGKGTLWNDSSRVPLIWSVPNLTVAGAKCEQGVDLMSIYPTVCELTGIPTPAHSEGVSIRPLLQDPAAEWKPPGLCTMFAGNHTLLTKDWRYTRYSDGTEELYNQNTDPNEWTNVANLPENAEVKADLARYLPGNESSIAKDWSAYY